MRSRRGGTWGFIVPVYDGVRPAAIEDDEAAEDAGDDLLCSETLDSSLDGDADEKEDADQPPRDRFLPSSIALTIILPEAVREVTVRATWGDYKTEPPLPDALLIPDYTSIEGEKKPEKPETLRWVRIPGEATRTIDVTQSRSGIPLSGSAAPQRPGGGLEIAVHQRPLTQTTPEGTTERLRVVTIFLVNRRKRAKAPYTDVAYAFQVRLELQCGVGFWPRCNISTYESDEFDLRLGDLHYRDVREYAVGRNTSSGWVETHDGAGHCLPVTRVWSTSCRQKRWSALRPTKRSGKWSSAWPRSPPRQWKARKRWAPLSMHCRRTMRNGSGSKNGCLLAWRPDVRNSPGSSWATWRPHVRAYGPA
jgi:hypothetical protein